MNNIACTNKNRFELNLLRKIFQDLNTRDETSLLFKKQL